MYQCVHYFSWKLQRRQIESSSAISLLHAHTHTHTVREAEKDINKLAEHLLDKTVTIHSPDRNTPAFKDPTDTGYKKLCNTSWVQEILSKTGRGERDLDVEDEDMADDNMDNIDLDYEIADVI